MSCSSAGSAACNASKTRLDLIFLVARRRRDQRRAIRDNGPHRPRDSGRARCRAVRPPWHAARRPGPLRRAGPHRRARRGFEQADALSASSVLQREDAGMASASSVGSGNRLVSTMTPGIAADASSSSNRPNSGCTNRPRQAPCSCCTTSAPSRTSAQRSRRKIGSRRSTHQLADTSGGLSKPSA